LNGLSDITAAVADQRDHTLAGAITTVRVVAGNEATVSFCAFVREGASEARKHW
jgi:hypothetical protein